MNQYRKNKITRSWEVVDNKVITTLKINDVWVSNPTEEAIFAEGWKKVVNTPMPTEELEGYYWSSHYEENNNEYIQVWDKVKAEPIEEEVL